MDWLDTYAGPHAGEPDGDGFLPWSSWLDMDEEFRTLRTFLTQPRGLQGGTADFTRMSSRAISPHPPSADGGISTIFSGMARAIIPVTEMYLPAGGFPYSFTTRRMGTTIPWTMILRGNIKAGEIGSRFAGNCGGSAETGRRSYADNVYVGGS